jgi:peptidoglycan L-alanyl-D-glutamate endopeptidase CwlK
MPRFGSTSRSRLETCHQDIQRVLEHAIISFDFTVVEGHRTLEKQQEYFRNGASKCDGIEKKSKHQSLPSMAVDIAPYHSGSIQWDNDKLWKMLARTVWSSIQELKNDGLIRHNFRWGGFWTTFDDKPHWEIRSD